MKETYILGISAFYHDSAACLIKDGEILAAAQEERFTRRKHDFNFPINAINYCFSEAGIKADDLAYVGFYDKPLVKFERILETALAFAPSGITQFLQSMPLWLKSKLWIKDLIIKELKFKGQILFCEHHESHAASAFYPSPFDEAAFLTIDGVGEWDTASFGIGRNNDIKIEYSLKFPHSLGLLYSAFTYYAGFKVNSGEYKLMGLAPYGEPKYKDLILNELIDLKVDGSFKLKMKYFGFCNGLKMTNAKFDKLFKASPRKPETKIREIDMDLARSIQEVTEEIMLRMARHVHKVTGQKKLCLAGGVALNCVGNGRILREGPFDDIWIQPASGDAGGALGVALLIWYKYLDNPRNVNPTKDYQKGSFLGPSYSDEYIEGFLKKENIPYSRLDKDEIPNFVVELIEKQNVIGWFQGRLEFGPRALGARSIIADARNLDMQSRVNLKIKFRESFRPLAPTVLKDYTSDWFDLDGESPYMLLVAPVKNDKRLLKNKEGDNLKGIDKLKIRRSAIPAVTHVDYSARIQTIDREDHAVYYDMIHAFYKKTGCPVIINTSFNVRGEPIVCTPEDAFRCFMRTEMDYLIMGSFLLDKTKQIITKDKIEPLKYQELD
ncbi:MAG: carbamoyltransferase [Candidatus Omnitrophota bacterium]|nr:carbamoyltransferase [Candidatus Omnitrophota bacterium]